MSDIDTQNAKNAAADLGATAQKAAQDTAAQAKQAASQAKDAAVDIAGQAKQTGADVTEHLKSQANAGLNSAKTGLADKLADVAEAVNKSGQQLEGHQDFMAGMIERGASELSTLADTLRNNDLNGLLNNMRDLGRRQPALFTGLSIAAGFALVRIGKLAVAGASRDDLPKLNAGNDAAPEQAANE